MTRHEIDCKQGSAEWHRARLGIPTASRFADIITPTGKAAGGATRKTYLCQLLAERMTGQLMSNFVTPAMQRGIDLEPMAKAWYQIETERPLKNVGFVQLGGNGWMCGCSPDGMSAERGVEIKCPLHHTIIGQLLADVPPPEYVMQCQGGMWICGVLRWDLVLFSGVSGIPNRIFELTADKAMFEAFDKLVPEFCAELNAATAKLVAMGGRERWLERSSNGEDILEG